MTKKLERKPLAIAKTPGSRAVADVVTPPAHATTGLERVNVVLPRDLRVAVERRLLDLDRRVSFSGFVEAALREALAGDPGVLVDRWGARARRAP
jgi:hypothetical protein